MKNSSTFGFDFDEVATCARCDSVGVLEPCARCHRLFCGGCLGPSLLVQSGVTGKITSGRLCRDCQARQRTSIHFGDVTAKSTRRASRLGSAPSFEIPRLDPIPPIDIRPLEPDHLPSFDSPRLRDLASGQTVHDGAYGVPPIAIGAWDVIQPDVDDKLHGALRRPTGTRPKEGDSGAFGKTFGVLVFLIILVVVLYVLFS